MIVAYFEISTLDLERLDLTGAGHLQVTLAEFAEKSRVPGENADVAILTRNLGIVGLFADNQLLGRRDFDLEGHLYALLFHFLVGFEHVVDRALHIERLLGDFVVLAFDDFLEAANRVRHFDVLAFAARERFGHVEGL